MFNIDETTISNEEEGVWAKFKGSDFLIASSGSTKFQRLFQKLQRPYRRELQNNSLDPDIMADLMAESLSKTILLGWKNVVDSSGEEVPFSQTTAKTVLRRNAEFRDFVSNFATEISNFVSEEKEELGKSQDKSSGGKSSSEAA